MARMPFVQTALPLFSDLHSRAETLDITLGVVREMRREAEALGAREVGFLGDWSHIRGLIPVHLQNAWTDEFNRWSTQNMRLIILPGNHDQVDVNGRHALECFRSHPAIKLYDVPTVDRWGLWIPYRHDLEWVRGVLREHRDLGKPVFWHGAVLGAAMNDFCVADRGLTPEDFANFPIAILGHFHLRQQFAGKIFYVGSPWETRTDEGGQEKGFAVLGPGIQFTYHTRAWGPRHLKAQADDLAGVAEQLAAAQPSDVVRVAVPEAQVASVSKALAGRFMDYTVTPIRTDVSNLRTMPGVALTLRQHAERYVAEKKGDLSEQALMQAYARFSAP